MAKIHTLTYNGTKSSDLGVFVTGSGSFDAAELDVDKYEIPGRNGDLILSNNRYKNIEITYPAFIPKAFMDKAQNVRNWLRSSRVYARLEDTYDTDHYRLGIPTGVQSFSPANRNDGANFEMTFDCKPQRFLKVGETPETVEADVQTESGEIVTFETIAESPMTSAEVSFSPVQDLNGYDSPWPAGGGKNLLKTNDFADYTNNGVTWHRNDDGSVVLNGTATARSYKFLNGGYYLKLEPGTYTVSASGIESGDVYGKVDYSTQKTGAYAGTFGTLSGTVPKITFTVENTIYLGLLIDCTRGTTNSNRLIKVQIEEGSTATEWSPYSNICPISGHTGATLYVSPTASSADATTYPVTFTDQGTVYGGTFDFVTGEGKITMLSYDLAGRTWTMETIGDNTVFSCNAISTKALNYNFLCNKYKNAGTYRSNLQNGECGCFNNSSGRNRISICDNAYSTVADFVASIADIQVVYELATPTTFTLSPQQIETLLGENNVWSDAGPITLTYAEPYTIENPTIFDARPLFTVTNPAEGDVITVNGRAITFVDGYSGTVFIDCETMNAYSGAANLNSIIEATDFPVLVPGTNIITWTGAGVCTMTPRWWEL